MHATHLECSECDYRAALDHLATLCPECHGPLVVRYDLTAVRASVDRDALAYGGTRLDHVINDQHFSAQRCSYQYAALTVCFSLFPVVGERYIAGITVCQGHRSGRGQGNALIGRPQQHIEFYPGVYNTLCITPPQHRQSPTAGKLPGIEKIRALSAGLQGKLAEF